MRNDASTRPHYLVCFDRYRVLQREYAMSSGFPTALVFDPFSITRATLDACLGVQRADPTDHLDSRFCNWNG